MTGDRFGRLVALGPVERRARGVFWLCRCDCGSTPAVLAMNLQQGVTRSCGCLAREVSAENMRRGWRPLIKHGKAGSPVYRIWKGMIHRCHAEQSSSYSEYGGRGIQVCDRWRVGENGVSGFECFFQDMGERPDGYEIERIDNNDCYRPGNCRWATRLDQARNTRRTRYLDVGGVKKCLAEWCSIYKIPVPTVHYRLKSGWPAKEALTLPPRCGKRKPS